MTCVVAVAHRGDVWMGADSAGVSDLDLRIRADMKVWVDRPFVFGFCGSFRAGQLLRHKFTCPEPAYDVGEFMIVEFVDALRETLAAGGHTKVKDNVESIDSEFLVGVGGRIFHVESDFQVGEHPEPFSAIGCGYPYALGALETVKGTPRQRITRALEVAEKYSAGVRRPFHVVQLRGVRRG